MTVETVTPRAARFFGPGDIRVEEIDLRPLKPGEILVEDLICGLCGTDLAKWKAGPIWRRVQRKLAAAMRRRGVQSPEPLGHEFGGVVTAVGPGVTNVRVGDTVATWIRPGAEYGGLATHAIVEARYAVRVPHGLVWALEPLMCVVSAIKRVRRFFGGKFKNRHVVVIGTGAIGLLTTAVIAAQGPASLTVIGRSKAGLLRAKALGATATIEMPLDDPDKVLEAVGKHVDVVCEAVGTEEALLAALHLVVMNGVVCVLGYDPKHQRVLRKLDWYIAWRAITMISGHTRDPETAGLPKGRTNEILAALHEAAELLRKGKINPEVLVARDGDGELAVFSLDQLNEAFTFASKRGAGKVLVRGS